MPCLLIGIFCTPESFHSMTALYVMDPNIAVKVFLLILGNRSISNFRIITTLLPAWLALGIFFSWCLSRNFRQVGVFQLPGVAG